MDDTNLKKTVIQAIDHLDGEGSVVRSGLMLAEAVLQQLEAHQTVHVRLHDLRGASSSYFNVFLRRLDEVGVLAEIGSRIILEFGSNVQKMVFERSHDAVRRGAAKPNTVSPQDQATAAIEIPHRGWWSRLLGR